MEWATGWAGALAAVWRKAKPGIRVLTMKMMFRAGVSWKPAHRMGIVGKGLPGLGDSRLIRQGAED